jgi:hypothetical protein
MKTKNPRVTNSAGSKAPATKRDVKSANQPAVEPHLKTSFEQPVEVDRRGKPLPPRQRVGGIITPQ